MDKLWIKQGEIYVHRSRILVNKYDVCKNKNEIKIEEKMENL